MRFIFLTLTFVSMVAFAQQPMNLETCMRYAIENSYKTARAATDVDNAKKNYTGALLAHLPEIDGSVGLNYNFGRGIDPETNTYSLNTTSFNHSIGLSAGIPIFNGLRYLNQTRAAKIAMLRGEEQLRQTRDKVAEETMLAYAEVVYNTELLELQQKRIENYKMEEKRIARLLELGAGSSADLAQIRATLASEEYNALITKNNLKISIIKLKDVMNFPLGELLLIVPKIETTMVYLSEQTPADIITYALIEHPSAVIERRNFELQKRSLSLARGAYYPTFYLSGSISTGYFTSSTYKESFFTQYQNHLGEWVGLHVSVPVFNGLDARLRVSKAKNNLQQAQRDYDETLRVLSSEISQAIMELEASESQWLQAQKNVEYQQIANQANRRKFEVGTLSIIELQTSDNQLFLSEIELRNAYLKYQIKIREVNYYKGVPYLQ